MSLSTLVTLAAMFLAFRLGEHNVRNPGELAGAIRRIWQRASRWFN